MNRDQALPQLGLPATATQRQIDKAYQSAVAELEMLTRNIPAESLSASIKQARADLDRAYEVLRQPPEPEPKVEAHPPAPSAPVPAARPSRRARRAKKKARADEKRLATSTDPEPAPVAASREEADNVRPELEAARTAARAARREVEEANEEVSRLRAEAAKWHAEVQRLAEQAKGLHEAIVQVHAEAARELEAIQKARRTGDEVMKSLYRNEEEANAAATHAEAYRDGAMFASQAAEKLLRELKS